MRATYLHYRNPKEETPSGYFPQNTNSGRPINRFEYNNESESKKGSFSKDSRFAMGSIYKDVIDRTTQRVGPGTYRPE